MIIKGELEKKRKKVSLMIENQNNPPLAGDSNILVRNQAWL